MKVQSASNQAYAPSKSDRQSDVPISYASRPGGRLHLDPAANSVVRDEQGQAHIKQGDQTYPVRYDKDNGTWRVFSPENPTKYQYPVKRDASGNWQAHSKVGLPGGGIGEVVAATQQEIMELQLQLNDATTAKQGLSTYRQTTQNYLDSLGPNPPEHVRALVVQAIAALDNELLDLQNQISMWQIRLQQLQNAPD